MVDRISRRLFLGGLGASLVPGTGLAEAPLVSLRPVLRGPKPSGAERLVQAAGLPGDVVFAVADVEINIWESLKSSFVYARPCCCSMYSSSSP